MIMLMIKFVMKNNPIGIIRINITHRFVIRRYPFEANMQKIAKAKKIICVVSKKLKNLFLKFSKFFFLFKIYFDVCANMNGKMTIITMLSNKIPILNDPLTPKNNNM